MRRRTVRLATPTLVAALWLGAGAPAAARPEFAANVRLFEITQPDGLRRVVPAVEQDQTAAEFYDYWSASSHTGYERRLRSILFLHRDLNTDALGLVITHGIDDTGQPPGERQPNGRVDMDLEGVPAAARVTQSDDPSRDGRPELSLGHEPEGWWNYGNNTDGGALSDLPIDEDWAITITPRWVEGNDSWAYHFADGTLILLDMAQPVTIRSRGQSQAPDSLTAEICQQVTVCAFVTDDPVVEHVTTHFDWGDGTESEGEAVPGQLFCEDHVFEEPGEHQVRITATNEAGEAAEKIVTATIRSPWPEGEDGCATGEPGVCGRGRLACVQDQVACVPAAEPSDEVCDGEDDDCDGEIDEGVRNACGRCGDLHPDVCNGVDDDCDGDTDEDPGCPEGETCVDGACAGGCVAGECVDAVCVDGACIAACEVEPCLAGHRCDRLTGECVDPCDGVACDAPQVCADGRCVEDSCYGRGCPDGEVCADGGCVADPCADVACEEPGRFCRGGECRTSCAGVSCPASEVCRGGQCEPDVCAGVRCPAGDRCVNGACAADPCAVVECPAGRACVDGECADDPCLSVRCADNERCDDGECVLDWVEPGPPPTPQRWTGGDDQEGGSGGDAGLSDDGDDGEGRPGGDPDAGGAGAPGDERPETGEECGCKALGTPTARWIGVLRRR